jgi:hypothetical protein
MKSTIFKLIFLFFFIGIAIHSVTSAPPPPSHEQSGTQCGGGGAPIGSGLFILLGLAGAYGTRKLYIRSLTNSSQNNKTNN